MPKSPLFHANERVDKVDLDYMALFGRDTTNLVDKRLILDRQDRIVEGFRVELPNQLTYPGRIVIHGGVGLQYDGQLVFTEDQLNITRDITLEGASTTFYVEIEFYESDSDVDARAFWDTTVDQGNDPSGDPKPDGQEFFANVATRKTPDWRIVTPVSTTGFQRDQPGTISSNRIPLVKLTTNASNEITGTGLTTSVPSTLLLEVMTTSSLRVQDPQLFKTGYSLIVGYSLGTVETLPIATVDYDTGLITLTGVLINSHNTGEVLRASGASVLQYIDESLIGRYRRPLTSNVYDYRDRLFQGDEEHGHILAKSVTGTTYDRSDTSMRALKDYIDYLSAQIQELKWGSTSPYIVGESVERTPPGLIANISTSPRYYHKSSGVNGSRTVSVTVGDGVQSWGDFIGAGPAVQAAINSLPSVGGTVYLRAGSYSLATNLTISKPITIIGDQNAFIYCDGGCLSFTTTGRVFLKNLNIYMGSIAPSSTGIVVSTSPYSFVMEDCLMRNASFDIEVALPTLTSICRCVFQGTDLTNFATKSLVKITLAAGAISGTWSECTFSNLAINAGNGTCIHGSTATTGIVNAEFINCSFYSALVNWELIHLGSAPSNVHFSRCAFGSGLTTGYITLTNGSNIWFTSCYGTDNFASFLSASSSDNIFVEGYLNTSASSTAATQMIFTNCINIKIRGCSLRATSTASLTGSPIKFINSSLSLMNNIIIEDNDIKFTGNLGTGIMFDLANGTLFREVIIRGNQFEQCETGIYFNNSGIVGGYDGITIEGNDFFDQTSLYQKIGIYVSTTSIKRNWLIVNNVFTNINPPTTSVVGAAGRGALYAGGSCTGFTIKGNQITNVGDSANAVANTAAFRMAYAYDTIFENNTITGVYGTTAYGIKIDNTFDGGSISHNIISTVSGSGGNLSAIGITSTLLYRASIVGNTIKTVWSTGSLLGAMIGTTSVLSSGWSNVEIVGNDFLGTTADGVYTTALYMNTFIAAQIAISGNTCGGQNRSFLEINSSVGGFVEEIAITGNTVNDSSSGIIIDAAGATGKNVSFVGNIIALSSLVPIVFYAQNIATGPMIVSNNTVECLFDATLLRFRNVKFARITDNHLSNDMSVTNANYPLYVGAGCDFYTILHNTVYQTMGAPPHGAAISIYTSVSGCTNSYVNANFIDGTWSGTANDNLNSTPALIQNPTF